VLTAAELPISLNVPAYYLAAPAGVTRDFDITGLDRGQDRIYQNGSDFADDELVSYTARPIADLWFAETFPGADYVVPLEPGGTILGAYHLDEGGLYLHGLASEEPDPPEGRTLWRYEEPLPLLRFPLSAGVRYTLRGQVNDGRAFGLVYTATDTYTIEVLDEGTVELPDASFQRALVVQQDLLIEPSIGDPVESRIVSFYFECFGEVARASAPLSGGSADFRRAESVRRFTLRTP
jgi:hypothetical protein